MGWRTSAGTGPNSQVSTINFRTEGLTKTSHCELTDQQRREGEGWKGHTLPSED